MAAIDNIRNSLINKILFIRDQELLQALDTLISTSTSDSAQVELTEEQKVMLEMSERDIGNGSLISQEEMDKRNLEWLSDI